MKRSTRAFLRADVRRVLRDQFLIGMTMMVLGMALGLRFALPAIAAEVPTIALQSYYPLMVSYMVCGVSGLMAGSIGGFLLLETREERTIVALAVTPVSLASYLRVSASTLAVLATVLAFLEAALIGLGLPPLPALIGCALVGAGFAPVFALFIAGFASNKIEAFAIMKIVGVGGVIPLGAWFVPEPWQWIASVYPPYLVCKAWWVAEAGGQTWPLWLALAVPVTAVYVVALGRKFVSVAARS